MKKIGFAFGLAFLALFAAGFATGHAEVVGDYAQTYHLNSKTGFLNDIQSIFFDEEKQEYNFYYLHNKDFAIGGNGTEWEHVTTKDFVSFEHIGTAIPKYQTPYGDIASGTLYRDFDNRLGFGQDALISYVTSYGDGNQTQNIWYSTDNGQSFTPYEHNPIMTPVSHGDDFRDPFVFRLDDTFYMYLAEANKLGVYESKDGIHFSYKEGIYDQIDRLGLLECPNLFELTTTDTGEKKWVLLIGGNGYERNETTGTYYVVGSMQDGVFQPETEARRLDSGTDFYGAKFMQEDDYTLLGVAWLGSWDYSDKVMTSNGNLGSMTMARMLSLTSENNYTLKTDGFHTGDLFTDTLVSGQADTRNVEVAEDGYRTALDTTIDHIAFSLDVRASNDGLDLPSHVHIEIESDDSFIRVDYDTTNGYYMVTRTGDYVESIQYADELYNKAHVAKVDSFTPDAFHAKLFIDNASIELYFPDSGNTYSLVKFSKSQQTQVIIKTNGEADVFYEILR